MRIAANRIGAEAAPRWGDIDPQLLARLTEAARSEPSPASSASGFALSEVIGTAYAACTATLLVTLYTSVLFHWGGPRLTALLISLPAGLVLSFRGYSRRRRRGQFVAFPRRAPITSGTIDRLARLVAPTLSPIDRAYLEIVAHLPAESGIDGAAAFARGASAVLTDCNALLAAHRALEQRLSLLTAQRAALAAPRDGDELSATTAANLTLLDTAIERAEGQIRAVQKAFDLLRGSLAAARATVTSAESPGTAAAVERVVDLAHRLTAQARAAEGAAAELSRR